MTKPPLPRFAVECEEDGTELGRFALAGGLFSRVDANAERQRLTLRNGTMAPALQRLAVRHLPRPLGNVHIGMLDREGRAIGRYFFADARLSSAKRTRDGLGTSSC